MKNKTLLNFGFEDDNLTIGVKPNESNIAVKVLEKKKANIKITLFLYLKKKRLLDLILFLLNKQKIC